MKNPSLKQLRFVQHYQATANGTEAARKAGYKGNDAVLAQVASENLRKPQIAKMLAEAAKPATAKRIADAEAIRNFWTEMLNDQKADPKDRLKASELLGKTMGIFLEKKQVDGKLEITVRRGNDAAGALAPKEEDEK